MAIFSSHLLDATNGSHAGKVDVIIYQINENGDKAIYCETKSDELIKIPMLGSIDSLNVSVSTAIVLYEINKQNDFKR